MPATVSLSYIFVMNVKCEFAGY